MDVRLEAIISGRVQMVMYRDFATRKARGLKLVGEVRNLADGTVSVIAEGSKGNLEKYIEKLRKGPLLSHVQAVQASWLDAGGKYSSFSISYE